MAQNRRWRDSWHVNKKSRFAVHRLGLIVRVTRSWMPWRDEELQFYYSDFDFGRDDIRQLVAQAIEMHERGEF